MSTADRLLDRMFSWIEQRERCAEKLVKLARELESLREKCNASECVGSTVAVVGAGCMIGAGVATFFTAGLAAPLLLAGGVYTGVGVGISLTTKLIEHLSSSDTMEEAKKIERKNKEITEEIQKLFEKLRAEKQTANPSASPDDLDQHVMTETLKAMARRSGSQSVFITRMLDGHPHLFFDAGQRGMTLNPISTTKLTVGLAGVLLFFTFKERGKKSSFLFAKGGQQLLKKVSSTGLKTALKGGAMIAGGLVGLAFELPEAIDSWKKLAEKNHVTEASQSLRDTAEDLRQISQTLKRQLDKIKQRLQELEELKSCIENSNRTPEQQRKFVEIVLRFCTNAGVRAWLENVYNTEIFFKLVDTFYFLKEKLDEQMKKVDRKKIDIIFVAHGCIEEPMISASDLLPLGTIEDVVLYSPWNSAIDAHAAYGIATGRMQPGHRTFHCLGRGCRVPDGGHRPTNLPYNWNSMRNAAGMMIPNISVSPLRKPRDPAWEQFLFLQDRFGRPGMNRVVIPYMLPECLGSGKVPFFVISLALSLVLFIFPFRATLHLAACLGRISQRSLNEQSLYLNQQYVWAIDHTMMSSSETRHHEHPELYRALRSVFDR